MDWLWDYWFIFRFPQIQFLFFNQDFYLCCWVATTSTSSKTFTVPEAEDETEGEAKVEAEGETEGEAEDEREGDTEGEAGGETEAKGETQAEGGPEGEPESTPTVSAAERSPAVTHESFGAPQEGVEK